MYHDFLSLNYKQISNNISRFISRQVESRKKKGVVIGLSGGLDSSVCLVLACKAIKKDRVLALIMPERAITPKKDIENARYLANELKINYNEIHFESAKTSLLNHIPRTKLSGGNISARLRMTLLYHYAGLRNLLVLGTSDKSELMIGYFTKFGDGAADLLPIGGLYKSQVKLLGKELGLPNRIVNQPSSPRLWKGHLAEKQLGLSYNEIDIILQHYLNNDLGNCGQSKKKIKLVIDMMKNSQHKREQIPICKPV
jgi:NAD+ synthase